MTRISQPSEPVPPYDRAFAGILRFKTFTECEKTLAQLENLRQGYLSGGDSQGFAYCRETALLGRRRAEAISRNEKVIPRIREQKKEMAKWFGVWLENPNIFQDWLHLRKGSQEFRELQKVESVSFRQGM
jgi:hypothetical protein